jgi:hypothetical protein
MNELFKDENWIIRTWRPAMAWLYMAICAFDFILAPILFIVIQAKVSGTIQWQPLTLMAGGLFHLAMGAIVGVAAWTRGQEKVTYMDQIVNIRSSLTGNGSLTSEDPLGPALPKEEKEEEEPEK